MSDSAGIATEHRNAGRDQVAKVAILTVSDSRTLETDLGGKVLVDGFAEAGHQVVWRDLVADEPVALGLSIDRALEGKPDFLVLTGGTGMGARDRTVEVVSERLEREMRGFGELFRMLSWEEVGSAAMLSGATAGLIGDTMVFALPGSPKAVNLALDRLILPEIGHLLALRRPVS